MLGKSQLEARIIHDQMDLAMEELKKHKNHLDKLVEQLMEKNRLTRKQTF